MEKNKIIVATGNQGKLKEIQAIFSEYDIISMKELGLNADIPENQNTFEGNALQKATSLSQKLNCACIADDSGICIKSLNGFPGVKTKRWFKGTDRERNLALIEKLQGEKNRECDFITSIAFVDTSKSISIVKSHIVHGNISTTLRGKNGFGFDEIFELENGKTIAELSQKEKNSLSPRKFALEKIKKALSAL